VLDMRSRKEIWDEANKAYKGTMTIGEQWIFHTSKLQLEVLLDIRKMIAYQLTHEQLMKIKASHDKMRDDL